MTTRIYLSAPITGHDLTERKAYFRRMADRLLQLYPGAEIVSPLDDIDTFISDTRKRQGCDPTHTQYMRRDLLLLLSCDVICLGHGHHVSKGCQIEYFVATSCGLDVIFYQNIAGPHPLTTPDITQHP